jgi:hypothetical protein
MVSFLLKKAPAARAAFACMALLFLAGALIISCNNDPGPDPLDAAQVSITTQPTGGTWDVKTADTHTLTVAASKADGGELSYQWYTNTSTSNSGGTVISGKTSASLVLAKADYKDDGDYYFYVEVTNTNNGVDGSKTASVTSNTAAVFVKSNTVIPNGIAGFWQTEHSNIEYYYYGGDASGPLYYADIFCVDTTANTLYYYQDTSFETYWAGTVVRYIEQDDISKEPAILIVKLTAVEGAWYTKPEVGKYFAYSYKNVAGDIASSAQAYSSTDGAKNTGVTTVAEAISEYTAEEGYFNYFGTYKKRAFSSASALAGMQGKWHGDPEEFMDDYCFQIRGNAYLEYMDDPEEDSAGYYDPDDEWDMVAAVGLIVDCTDTSQTSGVLYVQILGSDTFSNFKFIAVGWKNKTNAGIDYATSSNEYADLAAAKTAKPNATSFTEANYGSYFKE